MAVHSNNSSCLRGMSYVHNLSNYVRMYSTILSPIAEPTTWQSLSINNSLQYSVHSYIESMAQSLKCMKRDHRDELSQIRLFEALKLWSEQVDSEQHK